LAARIFADAQARLRLNAIMHPPIRRRIADEIADVRASRPGVTIVVDIPLLLDAAPRGAYPLDGVLVVAVDDATQVRRLMARDAITEETARERLRSQRPLSEKVALADWVIDNSGTAEETRRQVEALWRAWQAPAPDA
jgi:dephospho-CoA kinase